MQIDGICFKQNGRFLYSTLVQIAVDNFVIPEGVEEISNIAFHGQSFSSITLPHTLKKN